MREIADSAKTTYRSVYETAMTFYKQNKKGDLETAKLLGVELTKWHKEDEILYGDNIVATVDEKYMDIVSDYINTYAVEHCFETPNMHVLNDAFQKDGYRVCFMAEYFLPAVDDLVALPCKYETKVLFAEDFKDLYKAEWSNALCEDRKDVVHGQI